MSSNAPVPAAPVSNFIRTIIDADLASGKHKAIQTRFPPEPNGYLHVGHAKSICLNFGLAKDYSGLCNLRFDDTNPEKESNEYAQSIQDDVQWLGFQWNGEVRWASDYFDALYEFAVELINKGLAYVDDLTPEQMREYRGTLKEPGKNSPNRSRSVAENLDLFTRMKNGEFADGAMVLRAKIDMASPNMNMRDPAIYRIRRAHHIRTGDKWCIYPMYDYTHCISDALEGITHSICTLEFEDHRPLYDWVLEQIWEMLRQDEIAEAKMYFKALMDRWVNDPYGQGYLSLLWGKAWSISAEPEIRYLATPMSERFEHSKALYTGYSPQFSRISRDSTLGKLLSETLAPEANQVDPSSWSSFVEGLFQESWPVLIGVLDEVRGCLTTLRSPSVDEIRILERCRLPRQYEFSRLELHYTITSKRKLLQLVNEKKVSGWDDPRMPTISGMRRRGYTPEGIREFAKRIGVSKSENSVDMAIMEGAIREDLELRAPRVMAIINPLKVTITNSDGAQTREADFHPNVPELGKRVVPFSKDLLIEADDFAEVPPAGWKRLTLGGEIRLRHSYVMRCDEVVKDAAGNIIELKCSIDHATLGKNPEGRKVKGVIHFLSREHALPAEIRLYDRLFNVAEPDGDKDVDFLTHMNPTSLTVVQGWVEASVKDAQPETRYQFERIGYFCTDRRDHQVGSKLVFNRTVTLKDSWTKE